MTTFIEEIYEQLKDIRYISSDDFSETYLHRCPSYYRSLKARNQEAGTETLVILMESLGHQAGVMRTGRSTPHLEKVAACYEALGVRVGEEIARRSVQKYQTSKWVRDTLVRIIAEINGNTRNTQRERDETPPIIFF